MTGGGDDGLEGVDDPALELKFCVAAIPAMLAIAFAFHASGIGPFLQRTFFAMPLHEFGHATVAWLCGYAAIPTLWHTSVPEERGLLMTAVVAGGAALFAFRGSREENWGLAALAAALALLALAGRFLAPEKTAQMLITFGGDGLGMVYATLLMGSFFFGKDTQLYKGSLRWGFVAIGAAAFVNIFAVWWAARRDAGRIPFGEQEGIGLSDATRLVDWFGWTERQLVSRHVTLGVACLFALAAVYAWGVWKAWQLVNEQGEA
jgi:hypothetical protein